VSSPAASPAARTSRTAGSTSRTAGAVELGVTAEARVCTIGLGAGGARSWRAGVERKRLWETWEEVALGLPVTTVSGLIEAMRERPLGETEPATTTLLDSYVRGPPERYEVFYSLVMLFAYEMRDDRFGMETSHLEDYFWIEAGAGAGIGVRVGFNVAEFLDFLLGWAAIDVLEDDGPALDPIITK